VSCVVDELDQGLRHGLRRGQLSPLTPSSAGGRQMWDRGYDMRSHIAVQSRQSRPGRPKLVSAQAEPCRAHAVPGPTLTRLPHAHRMPGSSTPASCEGQVS